MVEGQRGQPSLAVAISLYDRWDELQGLLELLRFNWQAGPALSIAVVSTASETQLSSWVNRALATTWEFGSRYPLPTRRSSWFQPLHDYRYGLFKTQLRTRTVDCVCRAGRRAAMTGRDYTMHLHAAAWPLNESFIYSVLETMRQRGAVAAGRGYGQKLVDGKHPAGDIDDNFFIIDNHWARETAFWDIDPARDAEVMGAEGQLGRRLHELGVAGRVYFFDDFSDATAYEYPPGTTPRRVQPYNYHTRTGLLRSHDMAWQARLCAEYGYHGPFLDQLITQYVPHPDASRVRG